MEVSTSGCDGGDCEQHFHAGEDPVFAHRREATTVVPAEQASSSSEGPMSITHSQAKNETVAKANPSSAPEEHGLDERGFRRIIRNFTPS